MTSHVSLYSGKVNIGTTICKEITREDGVWAYDWVDNN